LLQSGRGFFATPGWSSVTIAGRDRHSFLQNFCTNDLKRVQQGDSCEAFVLKVKGKIVGHGLVTCSEEELVFLGAPGQAPRLVEHLDRYVIREDVQLRDSTSERCFVITAAAVDITHVSFSWNLIGTEAALVFEIATLEMPAFFRLISERGIRPVGLPGFDAARIEAGVPLFGVDFDEYNLPQEVGRDRQAISFTKGCYLGQETVARIDALGRVNQRIVGVRFFGDELPNAGAELSRAGAALGRVTSAVFSPKLAAPLALAMMRRDACSLGTRLDSAVGACEVIDLPLA
jgi:folate-binding protein YgfZ